MKGTEKQIKWAEDIKERAILAAGCIVRNAKRESEAGLRFYCISVEAAKHIEQIVIDGFASMDSAADIINIRDRFTQSNLEKIARDETKARAEGIYEG